MKFNPKDYIIKNDFDLYELEIGKIKDSPKYLQIALTDKCNLKCPNCPRSYLVSKNGNLEIETFKELIETLPDLTQVSFVGAGETLLVKNFNEYIKFCTAKNIFTSFNTNGILVETRLQPLIEAGLGLIAISVDACDDNLLSLLRPGLTVKKLQTSILAARKITENSSTKFSAAITLGKQNLYVFSSIIKFLTDLKVKNISIESFHHWGEDKSLNTISLFDMEPLEVIEKIEEGLHIAYLNNLNVKIFDYNRLLAQEVYSNAHCPWPIDSIYITSKGDVTPCCINMVASEDNTLGNISHDNISTIWKNSKYEAFRKSFNTDKEWSSCTNCVYRMEFGKIHLQTMR